LLRGNGRFPRAAVSIARAAEPARPWALPRVRQRSPDLPTLPLWQKEFPMKQNDDPITDLLSRIGQRPKRRGTAGPRPPKPTYLLLGLAAAAVAIGVLTSFFTVQPEEQAILKRFGRVYGIAQPGLHFKLPFGIDTVQKVATERVLKQ